MKKTIRKGTIFKSNQIKNRSLFNKILTDREQLSDA